MYTTCTNCVDSNSVVLLLRLCLCYFRENARTDTCYEANWSSRKNCQQGLTLDKLTISVAFHQHSFSSIYCYSAVILISKFHFVANFHCLQLYNIITLYAACISYIGLLITITVHSLIQRIFEKMLLSSFNQNTEQIVMEKIWQSYLTGKLA